MTQQPTFISGPPPPQKFALISFPSPYTLLVVFNRPRSLNCIARAAHHELDALFNWYDAEPSLRCAVVTGAGRAFCAGADLKEWNTRNSQPASSLDNAFPASGFGALSRRRGKKPVIGAVNGLAHGGGMEIVANLDMVVAAENAVFALPEAKRGVVAAAGALPRLVRTVGRPRAMEMALTGRDVAAREAMAWGIVNAVVGDADADEDVLERPVVRRALAYAAAIAANSPDSVIISRAGVNIGWEDGSAENGSRVLMDVYGKALADGENLKEGVRAFVEKRKPSWRPSKL